MRITENQAVVVRDDSLELVELPGLYPGIVKFIMPRCKISRQGTWAVHLYHDGHLMAALTPGGIFWGPADMRIDWRIHHVKVTIP